MIRLRHAASGILPSLAGLGLILWATTALGVDMGKAKSEICKARASCRLTALKTAGQSDAGVSLFVAEVALGLADKPADGPDQGCLSGEGDNDGGREYWLIEEGRDPKILLKLCNDGYGAAGVGDDQVKVAPNRLTHIQFGGSNDRWEVTETIQLSPAKALRIEDCGFRASDPNYAALSWIDIGAMAARSVAVDDAAKSDADIGDDPCSLLKGQLRLPAKPGFLAGVDVPLPHLESDSDEAPAGFAVGTVLGSCAAQLPLAGGDATLAYGNPDTGRPAEISFLALDRKTLILQLFDPRPDNATPKSWVASDHFEIWTSEDPGMVNHADPAKVKQIGIGLDGKAHAGVGEPVLPGVEHWQGKDVQQRPVTVLRLNWPDTDALAGGVTIAYSEAEGGRQARIFATAPIAKNRPLYLPNIDDVPIVCGIRDGRWDVTSNPGRLAGVEIAN